MEDWITKTKEIILAVYFALRIIILLWSLGQNIWNYFHGNDAPQPQVEPPRTPRKLGDAAEETANQTVMDAVILQLALE